ncbi:MAG TPA: hypothetical protein DDZ51_13625 [Planctomycetaceae bacterium]|nr:hypothetical protein [Planctomycetaceae bacterium]
MWPTSDGNRTLRGAEAILLANTIDVMIDQLSDYIDSDDESHQPVNAAVCQTGISVFDSLTITQRIAVLHHAALQLLTDVPFPHDCLSAIDDATIAAIYAEVRDQIEIEIDFYRSDSLAPVEDVRLIGSDRGKLEPTAADVQWRRLVHNACLAVLEDDGSWSEVATDAQLARVVLSEWEVWVDCLASAILWDRDFEFAESFLDADPESARQRRKTLGITDDYFVMPAPDPSYEQIDQLVRKTRELVRSFYSDDQSQPMPPIDDPDSQR